MKTPIIFGLAFIISISAASAQTDILRLNSAKLDNRLLMILQSDAGETALSKAGRANAAGSQVAALYPIVVLSSDLQGARALGIEPNPVGTRLFTARATITQIASLSSMGSVEYVTLAKKRKPLLDLSVPDIRADVVQNGGVNGTPYTGKGIIIGLIDTGIDWKHLDFRSAADATQSRIMWIWDQTISGTPPAGYSIGAEYSQAQINAEFTGTPPNVVKEQDTDGHGTHVAGIAAGNGSSSSAGYKGVAPDASIIAVKTTFLDNDILDGITYIQKKADAAGMPFVINLSLGSQESAHDGTDVDEIGIDDELQASGRAIAVAAGNEGEDHIHCDSTVAQGGTVTIPFSIPVYVPTPGAGNDDLWFDLVYRSGDALSVSVKSPNGAAVTAASGAQTSVETATNEGHVIIANAPSGANVLDSAKECTIEIFDNLANQPPRAGAWTLTVSGPSVTQGGAFDIWLGYTEITGNDGSSPQFTSGYSFRKLVGSPGTSKKAITVGSYVTKHLWQSIDGNGYSFGGPNRTNNYSLFSSMGPTRDGRQKPEICAPGEVIASSLSKNSTPDSAVIVADGKHVVMEGTSMATPHIAGVLALLLQAKPAMNSDELRNAITGSARKDVFTGSQVSAQWGFGKVDAAAAMGTVLAVRELSETIPTNFTLLQNFPNPFNPSTVISYQLPANSFVTLKVYDELGREVAQLVSEQQSAGTYTVRWDAAKISSGVYFYMLNAGRYYSVKKMVLMK